MAKNVKAAMIEFLKSELSKSSLLLNHNKLSDFTVSSWQRSSSAFPLFVFRVIYTALFFSIFIFSFVNLSKVGPGHDALWFIYLTHWGVTLIIVTGTAGSIVSGLAHFKKIKNNQFGIRWYVKVFWVLLNISTVMAWLITIVYWSVLYDSEDESVNVFVNVSVHAMNGVVMLLEILLTSHPTRFLHFYQPLGLGLAYVIFSAIFYAAGGISPYGDSYIYHIIDWDSPMTTILYVIAIAFAIIVLQAAAVALSHGRNYLASLTMSAPTASAAGGVFAQVENDGGYKTVPLIEQRQNAYRLENM